ncbi:ATP-binding protein [Virgibacillus sediminis]|uniref:histidine kinase n=1 Tax=Virgibacillus sediminis TaxID=202260 RepID=A0ABV7A8X0_9BACI
MAQHTNDGFLQSNNPGGRLSLRAKMIGLISLLLIGVFVIFAMFLYPFISDTMEEQIGKRALSVAQSVAHIPELADAFERDEPAAVIQDIVDPIREETGAEFIVVGNEDGIRYSHPNPDRIGEEMIGGDNDRALNEGESYTSRSIGSLGLSIRGKVPLRNEAGDIIGVVSVGFLDSEIRETVWDQSKPLWVALISIILLGIAGAIAIAHYLKKLLSDMEPEEISHLLLQKEAILQSTHEGIVAVDQSGLVTMMNAAARRIVLGDEKQADHVYGRPVQEIIPETRLHRVLHHGERHHDEEMVLSGNIVLVNRMPVYDRETIAGAVSTIRRKTELEHVTKELLQVKQYANAQRAQAHEFSNKLYIILGLLQLNQTQEAIDFIKQEKNIQNEWSAFLTQHVADPMVHGLLQGKYNQANELGVRMEIDPGSQLTHRLYGKKRTAFVTALGNLLENAIEAVEAVPEARERMVSVFLTDMGDDVVAEVEDTGAGIAEEDIDKLFQQGFTRKQNVHRGTGLALSKQLVQEAGGEILLEEGEYGGACFVVTIPKEGIQDE